MAKKATKESAVIRILKAPITALNKAREFYIRSMTQCAGKMEYGGAMGGPTANVNTLPKSFSVNSAASSEDQDLKDLIRVASTRGLNNKVEAELLRRQKSSRQSPVTDAKVVPRSQSVGVGIRIGIGIGIGRIDEDKSCEFDENVKVNCAADSYPRSRSQAVPKRTAIMV